MLDSIDIKYFKKVVGSSNLKETNNDISTKCVVCGDGKQKNKKRLHLYQKGSVTNVNCFNGDCPVKNKTVYSFLSSFFPSYLESYKTEKFKRNLHGDQSIFMDDNLDVFFQTVEQIKIKTLPHTPKSFISIENSSEGKNFLTKRKISPTQKYGQWFFSTKNIKIQDVFYKTIDSIVIPLYYNNEIYGFYSRCVHDKTFATYMDDKNIGYKVWNWFNIDFNKPTYIFEGVFDALSMHECNKIALLGAKISSERLKALKKPVFVLDNDRTGILNSIEYAKAGYEVFVQPNNITQKDMNELLISNNINIDETIKNNIYSGVSAEVRLKAKL